MLYYFKYKKSDSQHNWQLNSLWFIVSLFVVVLLLELATPVDYVFGYLYTGPVLIATSRLGRQATFYTTLLAVVLTMLNIWVPNSEVTEPATIASRLIAAMALIVTGILSDRATTSQTTSTATVS